MNWGQGRRKKKIYFNYQEIPRMLASLLSDVLFNQSRKQFVRMGSYGPLGYIPWQQTPVKFGHIMESGRSSTEYHKMILKVAGDKFRFHRCSRFPDGHADWQRNARFVLVNRRPLFCRWRGWRTCPSHSDFKYGPIRPIPLIGHAQKLCYLLFCVWQLIIFIFWWSNSGLGVAHNTSTNRPVRTKMIKLKTRRENIWDWSGSEILSFDRVPCI